jgi:hypothetical protein
MPVKLIRTPQLLWIALLCVLPSNAFASDVTMTLSVSGNDKPLLIFKTNLPPKSVLMVSVANPIDKGGDGYFAQQQGQVTEDQTIRIGPFTKSGGSLSVGKYQITVQTIMAALQPQEVQPFFGIHGEKLTGPQIALLPGTLERSFSASFQIIVRSGEAQSAAPPTDQHTIGSPDDKWQKVPGVTPELFIMTSGRYFTTNPPLSTAEHHSGYGFITNIVANLPESTTVGAPQSVMVQLEGNCESQHYSVLGSVFFAEKNRSGVAMQSTQAENIEKKLVPGSPIEKALTMLCTLAREQR